MTTKNMTTPALQIETPAAGAPMRSAQEAFQNHEDRMQVIESFARLLGEAFPHLRDAGGLPRMPHAFTADDMSGIQFDPNRGTLESIMKRNEHLEALMNQILERLPQLPAGDAPAAPTGGAAAW